MQKFNKYAILVLIVANYLMCAINLFSSEFTHSLNEFTIATLFLYIYSREKNEF